jgi:hypothetical protein
MLIKQTMKIVTLFILLGPALRQAMKFQLENCSWRNYSLNNNNKSWIIYLKCTQLSIAHFLQQCFPIFLEIIIFFKLLQCYIRYEENYSLKIWFDLWKKISSERIFDEKIIEIVYTNLEYVYMKVEYHFDFDFDFDFQLTIETICFWGK